MGIVMDNIDELCLTNRNVKEKLERLTDSCECLSKREVLKAVVSADPKSDSDIERIIANADKLNADNTSLCDCDPDCDECRYRKMAADCINNVISPNVSDKIVDDTYYNLEEALVNYFIQMEEDAE